MLANGKWVPAGATVNLPGAMVRTNPAVAGQLIGATISTPKLVVGVFRRAEPAYGPWLNVKLTVVDALKAPVRWEGAATWGAQCACCGRAGPGWL